MFDIGLLSAIAFIYVSTLLVTIDYLFSLNVLERWGTNRVVFWKRGLAYSMGFGWLIGMSAFLGNGLFDALFFFPDFMELDEVGDSVSGKKAICHGLGFVITLLLIEKTSRVKK